MVAGAGHGAGRKSAGYQFKSAAVAPEVRTVEGEQPALAVGQHGGHDVGVVNLPSSHLNIPAQGQQRIAHPRAILKHFESPAQAAEVWEYEPARFDGWTPDFRLVLGSVEAYAEVKPVTEFPMDAGHQRILNAGCGGDVLILGQRPRHARRYRYDGWQPVDLAASGALYQ